MTNIKFYIGSALILLFLIGGFIIWNRYLNRLEINDNREYELSIGELKRQAQNDSIDIELKRIALERLHLKREIDSLIEINKTEVILRKGYESQRQRNKVQIYKNTTDINKQFNDSVIYSYRSK